MLKREMATYCFTGKRVLVTGGANGVGKAIVKRFLETGATVIAVDRDSAGLERLMAEIPGASLLTLELDLSDWNGTKEAIEKVLPIHHLINNAGIASNVPFSFLEITESMIDSHFAVNYKAAFNLSQIFAKGIRDHKICSGTIVNISSVIDRLAPPGYSVYCSTKAALTMLSKSLASELGEFNIRSNTIRPDLMKTNMFNELVEKDPGFAETIMKMDMERSRLKKTLEPEDLCQLVLFLSSQDSSMITGVDIAVDGGFSIV